MSGCATKKEIFEPKYYEEFEGKIKLSVSEKFTEEKDGGHIFLEIATEQMYGDNGYILNSEVKIKADKIIVEIKDIYKVCQICGEVISPATFSKDLDKIGGDYQLILKHKDKEDKYNLKIRKDKIIIDSTASSFTIFEQSNIIFRVPENVIWLKCGHYDRIGCEENLDYVNICDRFFEESLISNLQSFKPEEGEYALDWFKAENFKYFKFFGDVSKLQDIVTRYSIYTSGDLNNKNKCLYLSVHTWKGDSFLSWIKR